MRRRIIALMLILVFAITSFGGCTKKDNANNEQENGKTMAAGQSAKKVTQMGRYMEKEVKLPKLKENERIIKIIQNADKKIELYTVLKKKYYCYQLDKDMGWKNTKAGWLNNGKLSGSQIELYDLCCGEDGNYYAVYTDYNLGSMCHIIKSEDGGKTSKEIIIPYLNKKQIAGKDTLYPVIQKINVLQNGNLVLYNYMLGNALLIFSPMGDKVDKLSASSSVDTDKICFQTSGNNIITIAPDKKGIVIYDTVHKNKKLIEYSADDHSAAFTYNADGVIYMGNTKGIHRLNKNGTLWETTVDGTLNSMSMPTMIFDELFVLKGEYNQYFASYQDNDGGYKLMQYTFDKNISSVPSHDITIYSLQENSTVRQAISMFQAKNSDVKVNYIVAMGSEGGTVSDYIRALNTELLAGNGADVLVLDGLPVDSYLEKGVLSDLSDIIKPLEDSGELLSNITNSYNKEGKIYQMPIRFTFPMILGKQEALSSVKDMDSIVNYIKQLNGNTYTSTTTYRKLIQDYLALYSDDLYENGKLSKDKLVAFIKKLKLISDNCKATENDENDVDSTGSDSSFLDTNLLFAKKIGGLNSNKYVSSMLQARDVSSMLVPFALINQYKLGADLINQKFIPHGLIGLNSASKERKIAKKFIQFLYSKGVQDSDVYDGFPINNNSLNKWINEENDGTFGFSDDDGNEIMGEWPTKSERESLLAKIKLLKTPIEINQVTDSIIINEILPCFTKNVDPEQAANAADSKINTYLAE